MRPLALASLAVPALLGAGCISNEPGASVMCKSSSDCDQDSGEVCDEGICYGDPPATGFAAVLVPADDRDDLAVTELPRLDIASDGDIDGLAFGPSVAIRGRVLLGCPVGEPSYPCGATSSIGAQITVERVASFAGGPKWSRQVVAMAGVPAGGEAFSVRLPRDPRATYQVTITPEANQQASTPAGVSAAELAPPRQLFVSASEDRTVEWTVGDPAQHKLIHGCVENNLGNGTPFAGMRVTALGRWSAEAEPVRASSLATTDGDGCFTLRVPLGMLEPLDILVKPAPSVALPTLRLIGEIVPDPAGGGVHEITPPLLMPNAATPVLFRLPVRARDSGGGQVPVGGADVRFTTTFAAPAQEDAPGRVVELTYQVNAVTSNLESGEPGVAAVPLYPGDAGQNRLYRVTVVPPAGSEHAAAWSSQVSVGTAGGTLESLVLGRRVGVSGRFESADGRPIADAPVEAKLSSVFGWKVADGALVAAAEALPLSTTTTEADGRFFLWLDREIVDELAYYDLEVKPATYAAPRFSLESITLGSGVATDLGELRLPEASYARGQVHDAAGEPVANAELRLYQLPDADVCAKAELAEDECEPPAVLRGVFASDELGVVRPVLPDP